MNITTLQKLEFNKVTHKLSQFCITNQGKKLAIDLLPNTNFEEVSFLLSETQEAIDLIDRNSTPSFFEISDINVYLKNIEIGSSLSLKAILELSTIFRTAQNLKEYFSKDYIESNDFPILSKLFDSLYTNPSILEQISYRIYDENTLEDHASKNLSTIRRNKRKLEQEIRSKLNDMIHSSFSKYVQEAIITTRNDRFVIPIKEEYRSQVKGFVHDVSNAGSTLFIEPLAIFEMNQSLNDLSIKEEIEIEKILRELTSLFIPYQNELQLDVELIGKLDFIFSKAKYAKNLKANIPNINKEKEIHLFNARHPLIDDALAIPISLSLGKDFSVLLITGPNTGGKTVTLKTVGLLTSMACSGLAIPADEKSSIYVFDKIFADIGDDQSISDSLSTFSSHMKNIIHIVNNCTSNSLVLVDELGSGTDPLEGANLAISILEHLQKIGGLVIATTHYQELKQYALITPGFENASVEFDIETLSPTYHLLVGVPGKSNAFEISKKLGLSNDIIDKAKSFMTNQEIHLEELLKNIYDDKAFIEKEKEKIIVKSNEIEELKTSLIRDNENLKKQEQELIDNAKLKARNILLDAKEEANEIIKEMQNLSNAKELNNLRNKLNDSIKEMNIQSNSSNTKNTTSLLAKDIKPNINVFVTSLNQEGIVLSYPSKSNEVQVQIGMMKMNLPISVLEKSHNDTNTKGKTTSSFPSISKSKTVKPEINVIGLNVEEAIFVIDKFLDDCSLAKLQNVRIVHGKGTGKLKNGIHQFLKTNPHTKSYRMGTYGEGEMGVTVVELK